MDLSDIYGRRFLDNCNAQTLLWTKTKIGAKNKC